MHSHNSHNNNNHNILSKALVWVQNVEHPPLLVTTSFASGILKKDQGRNRIMYTYTTLICPILLRRGHASAFRCSDCK